MDSKPRLKAFLKTSSSNIRSKHVQRDHIYHTNQLKDHWDMPRVSAILSIQSSFVSIDFDTFLPRLACTMGILRQKIWYSIMVCESKIVEISMIGYVYIRNILGIESPLLGVFDYIIIFLISYPTASESSATLGQ